MSAARYIVIRVGPESWGVLDTRQARICFRDDRYTPASDAARHLNRA